MSFLGNIYGSHFEVSKEQLLFFYVRSLCLCWGGGISEVNVQRNYFSSYYRIGRVVLGSWPNRLNEEFLPTTLITIGIWNKNFLTIEKYQSNLLPLEKSRIWESWVVKWLSTIALDILIYIYIYIYIYMLTMQNNAKLAMQKPLDVNSLIKLWVNLISSQLLNTNP